MTMRRLIFLVMCLSGLTMAVHSKAQSFGFSKVSENVQPSHPVAGEVYLGAMQAGENDSLPDKTNKSFYIRFPDRAIVDKYNFVIIKLTTVDGYYELEYRLDLTAYRGKALPASFAFNGASHLDILDNYTVDTAFISAYVLEAGKPVYLLTSLGNTSAPIQLYVNNDGTDVKVAANGGDTTECWDAGDGPYVMFRKVCEVPAGSTGIKIMRKAAALLQPKFLGQ